MFVVLRYAPPSLFWGDFLSWMSIEFCQIQFLHILRKSCGIFFFPFVNVVSHMGWFTYLEPSLWPWNKFSMIIVCDAFYVFLDNFCNILLRIFASIIIKDIGLQFSLCIVLVYCLHQNHAGLVKLIWVCSLISFSVIVWKRQLYPFKCVEACVMT